MRLGLVATGLAIGCTHERARPTTTVPATPTASRHARSTATAERIYALAEHRYAAGDYPAAVALLRRALLQLPETAGADARRHGLVLRIGHTQMRAWLQTGDDAFLHDAQRMLLRYAELHAALFGEGDDAQTERAEVWALLGQVELRLDEPERLASEDREAEHRARASRSATAPGGSGETDEIDDHYGEPVPDVIEREVVVKRSRLANLDDPRVEARLRSDYSSAEAGLVLTRAPGGDALHGPRGLVRARHAPKPTVDRPDALERRLARRVGYEVLRTARPALRRCYEDALAREAALVADTAVEVSVDPNGKVGRVRIVDGQLVDALGDVCLLEQLERSQLAEGPAASPVRVRLALRFMFQDAVHPDGRRGSAPGTTHSGEELTAPKGPAISNPAMDAMPGVDSFAY